MNNQKDIPKTELNSYGQAIDNPGKLALAHKPVYEFANKKTEKLVTALYMVTDCMEADEALKSKLRFLAVELLSDTHTLTLPLPIDKSTHVATLVSRVGEVLSFVGIASTIGFISEMNASILNREFKALIDELVPYQSSDAHVAVTLTEKLFEVEKPVETFLPREILKDKIPYNGHLLKRTYLSQSQANAIPPLTSRQPLKPIDKGERIEKILSLIKDLPAQAGKKNSAHSQEGISIKDISIAFTDCGEKTIQRELNALVAKGLIKKIGAKRWSRYQSL
jgi:hypothetical protein